MPHFCIAEALRLVRKTGEHVMRLNKDMFDCKSFDLLTFEYDVKDGCLSVNVKDIWAYNNKGASG